MATMSVSSAITVTRAGTPAKSGTPFVGTRRAAAKVPSRKMQVNCMQTWPIYGNKKFETLSYLPPLTQEQLLKQVEYLIRSDWIPCLEFSKEGFVYRENDRSPGYYDGRYWTLWKLPMFGCTDAAQVLKEVEEAKNTYPDCFIRILGFDNKRQVQCVSFIAHKPPGTY